MRTKRCVLLAVLFAVGEGIAACNIIVRPQGSTSAIEKILDLYSLKNEGAQSLKRFDKQHPILSFSPPPLSSIPLSCRHRRNPTWRCTPSFRMTSRSCGRNRALPRGGRGGLLSLSLIYAVTVIAPSAGSRPGPLFALTTISLIFFIIGILAPAMVIWTANRIPMEGGRLNFVVPSVFLRISL